jgi:hypothetical protein
MWTIKSKLAVLVLILANNLIYSQPFTAAEKSDYKSTSTNAEVKDFIAQLTKSSPKVKSYQLGLSANGQVIDYFVIANQMPKDPAAIDRSKKIVVYVQANIHAGEVEGKEAVLMYARDIITKNPKILDKVILVVCPNFNIDGNEPMSTENRKNQNGPVNGVGLRHNGEMLDLNRDAIKMESSEMKALLSNIIIKWDPAITLDCHTTNGSYHEEPVTFTWMMNPATDPSLIDFMRDEMMPTVSKELWEKNKVLNCFYGEFTERANIESGWISYASEPRYFTNYLGLRNRLAILNENYVYADFKSRVLGCYALIERVVEYAYSNYSKINSLVYNADKISALKGAYKAVPDSFVIAYNVKPTPTPVKIRANEFDEKVDENGRKTYVKTERIREVTLPYLAQYFSTKNTVFPFAYVLKHNDRKVIENLLAHGVKLHRLNNQVEMDALEYNFTSIKPAERLNQGHFTLTNEGAYQLKRTILPKGAVVVLTSQPLTNLICYMLEPQTNDCLLHWNYFDKYIVPQWGRGFYPYPVYKITGQINSDQLVDYK